MSDTLTYSESLAAFAPAFVELQAKLPVIHKDAESHHGKYADLAGTLESIRDVVYEHGFAVMQPTSGGGGGQVQVTTILLHKSGERMRDTLSMPTGGNGAQGVGSAISYARRYALAAMLSLAAEDDDGKAASQAPPRQQRAQTGTRARTPQAQTETASDHPDAASQSAINLLMIQCKKQGIDDAHRHEHVSKIVGRPIRSFTELTKGEASKAIDGLKAAS